MHLSPELKQTILEKVAAPPSKENLYSLISWLDIEMQKDGADETDVYSQLLARATIALGYELLAHYEKPPATIMATIRSAEAYALHPSPNSWNALFDASTDSYSFGPGNGCYSIYDSQEDKPCRPGSGCNSGSGSLASHGLDEARVMTVIALEVIPWIEGTDDPLMARS